MELKDLRFSKACPKKLDFPLKSVPKFKSGMHSPMVGKKHKLEDFPYDKYAELFEEVMAVRLLVESGIFPLNFIEKYYPKEWGTYAIGDGFEVLKHAGLSVNNPKGLAHVVHMDRPDDLFEQAILPYLKAEGVVEKDNTGYLHVDFVDDVGGANENLWDKLRTSLRKGFEAKYYFGVARPEEVNNYLTDTTQGAVMTHYPEGSPPHPSYPAGHSCVSGATGKFVIDNFDLNDKQKKAIRDACYLWGQFRTFAGVHYAQDNIAGLKIGGLL